MNWIRKVLLFPFALIWDAVTRLRNTMFSVDIFTAQSFDLPVIGVGNLSMGGSGKTPHVEYLIQLLNDEFPVAVMSRGYKRNTNGYIFASTQSTVKQIGDEPLQYKLKFPNVPIAVSENRVLGIPQLLMDAPHTQVIILDDVFQHRAIKPGYNILLTDYNHLFVDDFVFPAGNLRESRRGAKRAHCIIVTKCPVNLSMQEAEKIRQKINPKPYQSLYFSTYHYGQPYSLYHPEEKLTQTNQEVLLVTGIAKPQYLNRYINAAYTTSFLLEYPDHHHYKLQDISKIAEVYNNLGDVEKIVMITEKDAVKLASFTKELNQQHLPVYIQPIEVTFLFDGQKELNKEVINFAQNFYHD